MLRGVVCFSLKLTICLPVGPCAQTDDQGLKWGGGAASFSALADSGRGRRFPLTGCIFITK